MGLSPFLRAQLQELEAEHGDLKEKLASLEPLKLRLRLRDTRKFVEGRLANLESMLTGEPRIARAEIAKHVQRITLTPEPDLYRFGDVGFARRCGCYNGAGGQNCM